MASITTNRSYAASFVMKMMMVIMVNTVQESALGAPDVKKCLKLLCIATRCPYACPRISDPSARLVCLPNCVSCRSTCINNPAISQSCNKKGAICKDPRFIGGDGNLFYFHGKSNEEFCIVSDDNIHINGHFIGKHVEGRSRDFTWVQAIGIMYGSHKVSVGAKKVAIWNDDLDEVEIAYDDTRIKLDTVTGASWESPLGEFKIARTEDVNSMEVEVRGLLKISINVTHVDEEDNKIHHYGVGDENCFAHLDLQFTFTNFSNHVEGVLGQTYKPNYQSKVKQGVPMPIMGGYDKFKTSSLFASDCQVARFKTSSLS